MKIEEAKKVISTLKKQGRTNDEILYMFSKLYFDNKIDLEAFDGLVNLLGFHLDDEFKKMSKKDQLKWFKGER